MLAEINRLLASLSNDLKLLQHVATKSRVDVPNDIETRGNNADLWVGAVVKITAYHYTRLTGLQPNQSKKADGFHGLLGTIFDALGIGASVERAVKDAVSRTRT